MVGVIVFMDALQRSGNTHLAGGDADGSVEEVEIRKLTIDAIIGDVQGLEAVVKRIVKTDGSLKGSGFDGQVVSD